MNWSSGKDAALALYSVLQSGEFEVKRLFTSITADSKEVSMHEVPLELLERQAAQIGITLKVIDLPTNISKADYDKKMKAEVSALKMEGLSYSIFGDIFLEDLRDYREKQLSREGIEAVFPLWKKNTTDLMQTFLDSGFKAIVVSTNSKYLQEDFCGRYIDRSFLKDLPDNVDPCGENGEFHTFVFDGPIFKEPINFRVGEKKIKTYDSKDGKWDSRFCYSKLIPV